MQKKILIFDDDKDILFLSEYLLKQMGWEVHTSPNCNNIIALVKQVMPSIILMDNWIPDSGDIAATQKIKADEELRSIPVIFFSANNDIKNLAEQAGADTYLSKPFDIANFEEIINNMLLKNSA